MIDSFKGEHQFLSNFYNVPGGIAYDGAIYPTVENAFQAAKTLDLEERKHFETITPAAARARGRKVDLRKNWDYDRVDVMRELVVLKFSVPELSEKLLATGDEQIVEGNASHDRHWGTCRCPKHQGDGLNWLGRILMRVRKELKVQDPTETNAA